MVLGCMLTSINSLNVAADGLSDIDFYFSEHKLIFQVLKQFFREDRPADVHLIAEELKRRDQLKSVGGVGYLATLVQYAGTSAHIEEYVAIVRDKAILRRMISAAQKVETNALGQPDDVFQALDDAQKEFFHIGQSIRASAGVTLREVLDGTKGEVGQPFLKELEERQERFANRGEDDPGITGISTHFYDIDKLLNGLGRSNLIILAARPAMGKTALAVNIAENVAFRSQKPVGLFL